MNWKSRGAPLADLLVKNEGHDDDDNASDHGDDDNASDHGDDDHDGDDDDDDDDGDDDDDDNASGCEVEAGGSVTQERGRVTIRRLWSAAAAMPPL